MRPASRTIPSTCSASKFPGRCRCGSRRASILPHSGCRGARRRNGSFPGATERRSSCFPTESAVEMARPKAFNVVTYNIHKGLSQFGKRLVLHEIRDRLKSLDADVAFLQEVQGKHEANARRHVTWPEIGQHEFLTREGCHNVYGMNAVYQDGHHGNAVVSRHPIPVWENIDVSHHPMESRGLLHCEVQIEGWK